MSCDYEIRLTSKLELRQVEDTPIGRKIEPLNPIPGGGVSEQ